MTKIAHVTTIDLSHRFLLLPQLLALRDAGFEVTSISAPGPWRADLEAEGIRFISWPSMTRSWDPKADAHAFAELVGIFRRERFDLVHTHNPKSGVLGRLAARAAGVPCVVNTVHGLWATPEDPVRRRAPVLAAEWVAARFSDLELYQSEEDLRWARRLGVVRPGRWAHLGNGTDVERFHQALAAEERVRKLRAELGIGEDELVVGSVGRLVREKGYRELFTAARIVQERVPNVRFLIVGSAEYDADDAITRAEMRAVEDVAVFAGWRSDVPELMALMDVFCLPSWREGMPRSAIEAAASGLPLVLTDIRGCREVVRDGVEGFLVPIRDAIALSGVLVGLLRDEGLRTHTGRAARARAEERFNERRVTAQVVRDTRILLSRAGRPHPTTFDVRIRPARRSDAASMARLHRMSKPDAFLPTLGDRFLTRFYIALVTDPDAVTVVADADGAIVGSAAAVTSSRAFTRRFVTRHGAKAGLAAAPHLARPQTFQGLVETARYSSTSVERALPEAELVAIGVAADTRGEGVGRRLLRAVTGELSQRGVDSYRAVAGAENRAATALYERAGFERVGSVTVHGGTTSNVWMVACRS